MPSEKTWLWVVRWDEFQHYKPERDHGPAWIKSYSRQLDDDRFLDLSLALRGLLESLRLALGRAGGRLPNDTQSISRRIGAKVRREQIEALCDAGLIEVCSRATLEQRLEQFYASRAPARSRRTREEEKEPEQEALDLDTEQAGRRELQHASAGLPAGSSEDDPEPALGATGPMADDVRRELRALQPRGAAA